MTITRRSLVVLACTATWCASSAYAQTSSKYPTKPVKFIVPFAPGGGTDAMARHIAQKLNEKHGYTLVIENKAGVGGNLGAEAALREPADGYTFLVISSSYAVNAVLNKPSFDPLTGIEPVIQFTREPVVLAVGASTPYTTVAELVAAAKNTPDKVAFGSSGNGGLSHLAAEYFNALSGIKITHVPYKGTGAALMDLAGGQIQMLMAGNTSFMPLAKAGKVRVLAVGAPQRLPTLPNVPTFAEAGLPQFRADIWHGLVAAKGTPPEIVAKMNADINAVLQSPEVQTRLRQDDVTPAGGPPQPFAETIRSDIERWRTVVKQSNIKID
ncbi:Bug family tripartite tricarboxylate transporter substrate binding protein [Piscinibacter sakaiensis]|uniref:Bug family tripartite tricarboxylate transporter substrate binding protein n=1 Tax=Piscinibacter sakaiensis TaxID=1547922 RepID=UPI003AABAD83